MEGKHHVRFFCNPYTVDCPECGEARYHRCREGGVNCPMFQPHGARLTRSWKRFTATNRPKKRTVFSRLRAQERPDPLTPLTLKEFLRALEAS